MIAPPTVIALRALKLGNLLVCVPALRALRRHWPRHRLVVATTGWLAPLIELVGGIDEMIPVSGLEKLPMGTRAEIVVNLHGAGPESNLILDALRPNRRIGHHGYGWSGPTWRDDLHERMTYRYPFRRFDVF